MRTVPVNQSDGPLAEACDPTLLISIIAILSYLVSASSVQLLNSLATVDHHCAADDKSSRLRTKPHDCISDLFGSSHTSDRLLRADPRPPLGGAASEAVHHWSVDVTGAHDIDADVLRSVIKGRRSGEAYHTVFGCGMGGAAFDANDTGPRRGIHNGTSASLLQNQRDLVLHAEEHFAEVDINDPLPLVEVVFRRGSRFLRLDASVIKGEVQAPKGLGGLVQSELYI